MIWFSWLLALFELVFMACFFCWHFSSLLCLYCPVTCDLLRDEPYWSVSFTTYTNSDWNEAESEVKLASNSNTQQLWEEDWDHDDAEDDFSAQLKEELSKTR